MAGKFEIYEDKAGEFRFRLKARNGETILTSEGYKAKASAKNGVASVQKNCEDETLFDTSQTASGAFRFQMKAKNRQMIGQSQNYQSAASRNNGIKAVARAAIDAKIVDLTG